MNTPASNHAPINQAKRHDLDALADLRLRDFVPNAELLQGRMEFLAEPRSVARYVARQYTDGTWEDLTSRTVGEIMSWPNVGATKANAMINLVAACAADNIIGRSVTTTGTWTSPLDGRRLRGALEMLAAWGASRGCDDLIETIGAAEAFEANGGRLAFLDHIRGADLDQLSGPARMAFDPIGLLEEFVNSLDRRDAFILEHRFAIEVSASLTLEQIGEEFGVTRERIRQLEKMLRKQIDGFSSQAKYQPVFELVDKIKADTGIACPESLAPDEIRVAEDSLVDEILAYLAGPYQLVDGWFVTEGAGTPASVTRSAFDSVSENGIAPRDAIHDALARAGVVAEAIDPIIGTDPQLRPVDDALIDLSGSTSDRAYRWLVRLGSAQSLDELHKLIADGTVITNLANQMHLDPRFHRVGMKTWGLVEWGDDTYSGIVPAMGDAIEAAGHPLPIDELATDLADRFGISKASVRMNAGICPRFVESNGTVRLRRPDEPYVVTQKLETTHDCFNMDGTWALRIPVDHDVLRGSGRQIPESFADHLGLRPGYSTVVPFGVTNVWLGWEQCPNLGSIRSSVLDLGGEADDIVFVRRAGAAGMTLHLVRRAEIDAATTAEKICLLVGADREDATNWRTVLAGAIGFGVLLPTSIRDIKERLAERKDQEMLDLVAEAATPI